MNKDIKFSIIMLTYNHEKFINKAIESVLEQTYSDFELIIVNDGSTDNTENIIKSFTDSRIIYHYQENRGLEYLAKSYNETLRECTGEYICILEGDDYWSKNKLAIQHEYLDEEADIIWSKSYYVDSKDNIQGKSNVSIRKKEGDLEILVNDSFLYGNLVTPSPTVMFKREALLKVHGFADYENVKVVDYSTALLLLVDGSKYQFIDKYIGYYRRHENQATQMHRSAIYKEHNVILMNIFQTYYHKIDIFEFNNALVWNDILEKYSSGQTAYIYKYFSYIFLFNNKHKFKYFSLLFLGFMGKDRLYKIRERIRGVF